MELKDGFSFNKKLGQNFITDGNLLNAVCSDAQVGSDDCVLEVGVGAAALTKCLCQRARKVVGYEIDKRLSATIDGALQGFSNAKIIYSDILKVDIDEISSECGQGFLVVANLPYYITTPVIMKFIEESNNVKSITVMVQEEVALRLCAKADTKDYGAISAVVQYAGKPVITRKVPRTVFTPQPNVDSAVVRITLEQNRNDEEFSAYRKTVRAAFSMRRKTLVNNLSAAFNIDKPQAALILSRCSLDEKTRGETLDCRKFTQLTNELIDSNII